MNEEIQKRQAEIEAQIRTAIENRKKRKRMSRMPPVDDPPEVDASDLQHAHNVGRARGMIDVSDCFMVVALDRNGGITKLFSCNFKEARVGDIATVHQQAFNLLGEFVDIAASDLTNAEALGMTGEEE